MNAKQVQTLRVRDQWCWHCGTPENLVPHHRANRGMGGSKVADNFQNVILVCAEYNGAMESDAGVANQARDLGHKLSKFLASSEPVFDNYAKRWYFLDTKAEQNRLSRQAI
jgi:hypothetical protein